MERFITDERTGLRYELVGDYYLIVGDDEPEGDPLIGVWGQRHLRYLKEHRRVRYANLLTSGKLNSHLAEIQQSAQRRMEEIAAQMVKAQGVTEELKARDQMKWVGLMNSLKAQAEEIVLSELVYN